jgi:hypothetical protein
MTTLHCHPHYPQFFRLPQTGHRRQLASYVKCWHAECCASQGDVWIRADHKSEAAASYFRSGSDRMDAC